jgi:hypothetical protein
VRFRRGAGLAATAAVWLALVAVPAGAGDAPPVSPDSGDARVSLHLDPAVAAVLKETMREHLEALQGVVAALARNDREGAASITRRELGYAKHHEVMRREGGAAYPAKYRELAMAHHRAAEALADAIDAGDTALTLRRLDGAMRACVACHRAFRL